MLELFKIGGAKSWVAPEFIQANRLPSRATAYPYPNERLAQANVRDMDTSLASTPASLLSGSSSVSSQFEVSSLPPSGGLQWYQLVPKHADTDFQLVRIGFDKGELRSMFLADKLNQITQLNFSNSKRNLPLTPDLFSFVPPPGVDVIGLGK